MIEKWIISFLFLNPNSTNSILLANQSELPIEEVNNLFKGYDMVFAFWQKNNHIHPENVKTTYLTDSEIVYLLDLFNKQKGWNS